MPWKRESPMDQKVKLIGDWLSGSYSKSALARIYGLSRPTVDKWLSRYEQEGLSGLEERSRAPLRHPNRMADWMAEAGIEAKLQHQDWGPKKLVKVLSDQQPDIVWPAPSTVGDLLRRQGLVQPRKRRRCAPAYTQPFKECQSANQVWSIDYKGQFKTGDGRWCYPLTLTDNASRYLLACRGLLQPSLAATRPWLERAFRDYGLPEAIRSDNGSPFASTGLAGLPRLSVWRGALIYTSGALIGEPIELRTHPEGGWNLYFHTYLLGYLDLAGGPIRPPKV